MDWFLESAERETQRELTDTDKCGRLPTKCPVCGSSRLFISAQGVLCRECKNRRTVSGRKADERPDEVVAERVKEEEEMVKAAGGWRKIAEAAWAWFH